MTPEQLALIGEGVKLAAALIAKALEIEKSGITVPHMDEIRKNRALLADSKNMVDYGK